MKGLKTRKWGFLCCYNAQGQLLFNAFAIYMQFYSGSVSMVSKSNNKTEHYFWATGAIEWSLMHIVSKFSTRNRTIEVDSQIVHIDWILLHTGCLYTLQGMCGLKHELAHTAEPVWRWGLYHSESKPKARPAGLASSLHHQAGPQISRLDHPQWQAEVDLSVLYESRHHITIEHCWS